MLFRKLVLANLFIASIVFNVAAQIKWERVDSDFGSLPTSVKLYRTADSIEGKPNIAYYVEADLADKDLFFHTDTTLGRRLTPSQYFERSKSNNMIAGDPLVVVNTTFFSFATHQNLNTVVNDGKLVSYNIHSFPGRGKDTLTYRHALASAIGIDKKGNADVAWIFTDSSRRKPYAIQSSYPFFKDSIPDLSYKSIKRKLNSENIKLKKWKVKNSVGGGPVLVQNGEVRITNNEEYRFAGKAIDDRHPRTAMGYTRDKKLIILVVEGRNPGVAEGASLRHIAKMMKEVGCVEALNLDGGGSSCMLVNGKTTIKPSDKEAQQRPVPAVFIISKK